MNDLELMYLLDENGYEPTIKNLKILKEGLETGKYEILDEGLENFLKREQTPEEKREITKGRLRLLLGQTKKYPGNPEATERSKKAHIAKVEKMAAEHGLTLADLERK